MHACSEGETGRNDERDRERERERERETAREEIAKRTAFDHKNLLLQDTVCLFLYTYLEHCLSAATC